MEPTSAHLGPEGPTCASRGGTSRTAPAAAGLLRRPGLLSRPGARGGRDLCALLREPSERHRFSTRRVRRRRLRQTPGPQGRPEVWRRQQRFLPMQRSLPGRPARDGRVSLGLGAVLRYQPAWHLPALSSRQRQAMGGSPAMGSMGARSIRRWGAWRLLALCGWPASDRRRDCSLRCEPGWQRAQQRPSLG